MVFVKLGSRDHSAMFICMIDAVVIFTTAKGLMIQTV